MTRTDDFEVTRTGDRGATVRRRFAAPRDRVFAALTREYLLRKWLVATDRKLTACEVDLRAGGSYRYGFEGPRGMKFAMHGAYREVVPGRRIVHEESYDGYDWPPLVVTTTLSERAGATSVVIEIEYPSREIRDEDFPNLEHGREGYARLEGMLAGRRR